MLNQLIKEHKGNPTLANHIKKTKKISRSLRDSRKLIDTYPGVVERYTYDLKNQSTDQLPGELMHDEDKYLPGKKQDSIVDVVHKNHGIVRQFFKEILGRDSYDGKGSDLHGSVHVEQNLDNAFFYNGNAMAYGDGLVFDNLAKSLNVAAHELGHGVTYSGPNYVYWFEPGAINEAMSDIYGLCCEQWNNKETIAEAKWLVGWDIVTPRFPGKALRSFKDEKAYDGDPQPKHKKKQYFGLQDNGGVHINSGIINHAFYLFCLKYAEIVPEAPYAFAAPLEIFHNASFTLGKFSGFGALKKATLKVCKNKYPLLSDALKESWKEVGV